MLSASETTVGGASALPVGASPRVRLTPALLRNRQKLSCKLCPSKTKFVDEDIDDEAVEVQRPNVVVVGRGPAKLEVAHHVASGHAQNRIWCDACMTARGIAGRHERRVPGREDEDPLVAIYFGYLKLDGTEDDEDDDETT